MKPSATPASRLATRQFTPDFFAAALAAVSPEAESLAMMGIKSYKELNYRQLLKHP